LEKVALNKLAVLSVLLAFTQTACAEASLWDQPTPAMKSPKEMTVYRSPTCGCCEKWIAHMEKQGFNVKEIQSEDMDSVKQRLGVQAKLQSCHTAVVDGYVVEGHVPAGDVKKLLQNKPKAAGLAAPGMPTGSPGMEVGTMKPDFSVLLFDAQGKAKTFNTYSNH
jgi:hypothetical protein